MSAFLGGCQDNPHVVNNYTVLAMPKEASRVQVGDCYRNGNINKEPTAAVEVRTYLQSGYISEWLDRPSRWKKIDVGDVYKIDLFDVGGGARFGEVGYAQANAAGVKGIRLTVTNGKALTLDEPMREALLGACVADGPRQDGEVDTLREPLRRSKFWDGMYLVTEVVVAESYRMTLVDSYGQEVTAYALRQAGVREAQSHSLAEWRSGEDKVVLFRTAPVPPEFVAKLRQNESAVAAAKGTAAVATP